MKSNASSIKISYMIHTHKVKKIYIDIISASFSYFARLYIIENLPQNIPLSTQFIYCL